MALIGGVAGLVFMFVPGLEPGEKHESAGEPEVAQPDVTPRVPLQEYLTAERLPRGSATGVALRHLGVLATIRYTLAGRRGDRLQLDVSLADADTGATACMHRYTLPPANGATQTMRAWMAFPSGSEAAHATYNLHVSLFAPDGKPPPLRVRDVAGIAGPRTDAGPIGPVAAFC